MEAKKLTKNDLKKIHRVVKILDELSKEGVKMYVNAEPNLVLGFCKTDANVDLDEWLDWLNSEDGNKYYKPDCNIKLESYGY